MGLCAPCFPRCTSSASRLAHFQHSDFPLTHAVPQAVAHLVAEDGQCPGDRRRGVAGNCGRSTNRARSADGRTPTFRSVALQSRRSVGGLLLETACRGRAKSVPAARLRSFSPRSRGTGGHSPRIPDPAPQGSSEDHAPVRSGIAARVVVADDAKDDHGAAHYFIGSCGSKPESEDSDEELVFSPSRRRRGVFGGFQAGGLEA